MRPLNGAVPSMRRLVLVYALVLAVLALLFASALRYERGAPATATVVGHVGDRTRIAVVADGVETTWRVRWTELDDRPVGYRFDLRMVEGRPLLPTALPLVFVIELLVVTVLSLVWSWWRRRPYRQMAASQRQAQRVATQSESPRRAVRATAAFTGSTAKDTVIRLDVSDAGSGQPIGSVLAARLLATFHPARIGWMVGDPTSGVVAFETTDRGSRLVPVSGLLSSRPGEAPWSADLVRMLGWSPDAPTVATPEIGPSSNLSMAEVAPALVRWEPQIPEELRADIVATRVRLGRIVAVVGTVSLALVLGRELGFVPLSAWLMAPVILGAGVAFNLVQQRALRRRICDRMALTGPDADLVARLLAGLVPPPGTSPVEADAGSPPSVPPPPVPPPPVPPPSGSPPPEAADTPGSWSRPADEA